MALRALGDLRGATSAEPREGLREEFFDYFAAGLGELFVAAFVEVGELAVVEAEEAEEGGVKVANVVDAVDGFGA